MREPELKIRYLGRNFMQKKFLCCVLFTTSILTGRLAVAQAGEAATHVAAGEHVFKTNCSACHSTEADKKIVGPSLHAEMKGRAPKKTEAQVKTIIMNGNGTMPAFKTLLMAADIENLVAYLKTQ
jgi:mono/diheme cytochrome c family protein